MEGFGHYLLAGFGMMLVIEGLIYAIFPAQAKALLEAIRDIGPDQIRLFGTIVAAFGVALVYALK
ncbi:MAG: DUF2065 domain-containing protein [Alphaproteobacteria bacterium]|nr:MAG: DUF2065 domain-containing protein [Alphaproteobacteria bacterium]